MEGIKKQDKSYDPEEAGVEVSNFSLSARVSALFIAKHVAPLKLTCSLSLSKLLPDEERTKTAIAADAMERLQHDKYE